MPSHVPIGLRGIRDLELVSGIQGIFGKKGNMELPIVHNSDAEVLVEGESRMLVEQIVVSLFLCVVPSKGRPFCKI